MPQRDKTPGGLPHQGDAAMTPKRRPPPTNRTLRKPNAQPQLLGENAGYSALRVLSSTELDRSLPLPVAPSRAVPQKRRKYQNCENTSVVPATHRCITNIRDMRGPPSICSPPASETRTNKTFPTSKRLTTRNKKRQTNLLGIQKWNKPPQPQHKVHTNEHRGNKHTKTPSLTPSPPLARPSLLYF